MPRNSCDVGAERAFLLLLLASVMAHAQKLYRAPTEVPSSAQQGTGSGTCGDTAVSWYNEPIPDMKGWPALRIKRITNSETKEDCALRCTGSNVGMKYFGEQAEKEDRIGPWLACYSFTYEPAEKVCQLFLSDKDDETTTLVDAVGSMHYVRIKPCWNGYIETAAERCASGMLRWFSPPLVGRKGPPHRRIVRWAETSVGAPGDCALRCVLNAPTCYSFTVSTKDSICMLYSKAPDGEEDSDLVPAWSNMVHHIRDLGCWQEVYELRAYYAESDRIDAETRQPATSSTDVGTTSIASLLQGNNA